MPEMFEKRLGKSSSFCDRGEAPSSFNTDESLVVDWIDARDRSERMIEVLEDLLTTVREERAVLAQILNEVPQDSGSSESDSDDTDVTRMEELLGEMELKDEGEDSSVEIVAVAPVDQDEETRPEGYYEYESADSLDLPALEPENWRRVLCDALRNVNDWSSFRRALDRLEAFEESKLDTEITCICEGDQDEAMEMSGVVSDSSAVDERFSVAESYPESHHSRAAQLQEASHARLNTTPWTVYPPPQTAAVPLSARPPLALATPSLVPSRAHCHFSNQSNVGYDPSHLAYFPGFVDSTTPYIGIPPCGHGHSCWLRSECQYTPTGQQPGAQTHGHSNFIPKASEPATPHRHN